MKPLADALGVSVLEIMQSEREHKDEISAEKTAEALDNVICLAVHQRQIERRNLVIGVVSAAAMVLLVFLIDLMQWEGFFFVCMPFLCLAAGMVLVGFGIRRRRRKQGYAAAWIVGIAALLFPIILCLVLFLSFALGGPAAN